MGYRSDIVIAISTEMYNRAFLEGTLPAILKEHAPTKTDTAVYWKLDGFKWYQMYPEVDAVARFLKSIEERKDGVGHYGFIRIGEEDDDIVSEGTPWNFDIYIETIISCKYLP